LANVRRFRPNHRPGKRRSRFLFNEHLNEEVLYLENEYVILFLSANLLTGPPTFQSIENVDSCFCKTAQEDKWAKHLIVKHVTSHIYKHPNQKWIFFPVPGCSLAKKNVKWIGFSSGITDHCVGSTQMPFCMVFLYAHVSLQTYIYIQSVSQLSDLILVHT
jgi:hypothetical protein